MKKLPGHLSESIVGHFPKEIARFTYFIILRGGRLSAKVLDTQHRRSPLVQGGLEIPIQVTLIQVTLTMEWSTNGMNQLCVEKYRSLVEERYKEPVEGQFEDATADILQKINIVPEDQELNSDDNSDMEI